MYFISYSIYGLVLVWSLLESQPFSYHLYIYFLDMETTGFSSSRNDVFPAGLRVLVVDDDPTWLKILEKMLKKCLYQVTTCCLAREALELLRERKDGFDIVLSDVNMPDMDGFKLLEHVGLEMDLPVIMMSVDGETSRVMKGVQHGACDYLLKPIRMKELRNIWQHVFRKRIHEVRDIESHECAEEIQILRNGMDQAIDGYLMSGIDLTSGKKRKDTENNHDDREVNDASSVKKARVVWTFQLHQNFVKAVDQIGFDKVGPKKIMDLMNVPWLTRENVASHLQKYRLYLSRLNKNDLKASYLKNSDFPHGEIAGNFSLQNSVSMQHFDVGNGNYGTSGNKILVQNVEPRVCDGDLTDIISFPMAEAQTGDNFDSEVVSSSRIGLNHSLGVLEPEIKHPAYSSTVSTQYSWNGGIPEIQFKQEQKLHLQLENGVNQLKLPSVQNHNPVSSLQSAHSTNSLLNGESDKPAWNNSKSSSVTLQSQCDREVTPTESFSLQSESPTTDFYDYEPLINSSWTMKNNGLDQIFMNDQRSTGGNLILGRRSTFAPFDEDLHSCLLHYAGCPTNIGLLQNKESVEYNDPGLIAEAPSYLHDALRFDYEYPFDPIEYPAIDQGLFIA